MRKTILSLCYVAVIMTIISACNFHTYSNGDIDGYWQLTRMDSVASGKSTDMTEARVFWAVDAKLLRTVRFSTGYTPVLFRFAKSDNSLTLSDPHYAVSSLTDSTVQDPVLTNIVDVCPFGINEIPEQFTILLLNDDEMVLQGKTLRLYFTKF